MTTKHIHTITKIAMQSSTFCIINLWRKANHCAKTETSV